MKILLCLVHKFDSLGDCKEGSIQYQHYVTNINNVEYICLLSKYFQNKKFVMIIFLYLQHSQYKKCCLSFSSSAKDNINEFQISIPFSAKKFLLSSFKLLSLEYGMLNLNRKAACTKFTRHYLGFHFHIEKGRWLKTTYHVLWSR